MTNDAQGDAQDAAMHLRESRQMMEGTMVVTVVDRRSADRGYHGPRFVTITLSRMCSQCGGPRGEPYPYSFAEDGAYYSVSKWDNPCGHIDKYHDVLREVGR